MWVLACVEPFGLQCMPLLYVSVSKLLTKPKFSIQLPHCGNIKIEAKLQLPSILSFIFNYNFSRNHNRQQVWLIFFIIFNRIFNKFLTLRFAVRC